MSKIASIILLFSLLPLTASCRWRTSGESTTIDPIYPEELSEKLADPRLLGRLGVEEVILLEIEVYRVTIGVPGSDDPIGEMYYTIQDGWHLKADNERLEYVPGEGWLIAEQ